MGKTEIAAGQGAARQRRAAARVHRPHARSAEGRRRCASRSATRADRAPRRCSARCSAAARTYYFDRRDTITLGAGDAMATNRVTQMIDPWPRPAATATSPTTARRRRPRRALPHRPRHPAGATPPPARPPTRRRSSRRNPRPTARPPSAPSSRQPTAAVRPSNAAMSEHAMRMAKSSNAASKTVVVGADRRSGVRAVGARRRSAPARRSSCASCPAPSPSVDESRHSTARPSSSSISTPAGPRRWQALERLMLAHRRLAAGGGGDAELRRERGAQRCCRCGSPISWSSRCSRSSWCAPARASPSAGRDAKTTEAQIYTFLPAVGGAGVTTLAIQTACCCSTAASAASPSTCLVDLDFQHGACADYLDLEPRLDLERDRAAAGTARPAAARSDAVASRLRALR